MLVMLAGCLFVGETVQAAKKQPAAYLAQKDFGKKHEAVYVLLEQQEPSLAAAFLQVTEWMTSRNRATKAEKKEMGAFLSQVNKSSLRKNDKKTVRSFIHRATGKWSGGKIAGVAIGSYLGLIAVGALCIKKKYGTNVFTEIRNGLAESLSLGVGSFGLRAPHPAVSSAAAGTGSDRPVALPGGRSSSIHMVSPTVAGGAGAATGSGGGARAVAGERRLAIREIRSQETLMLSPANFNEKTELPPDPSVRFGPNSHKVLKKKLLKLSPSLIADMLAVRIIFDRNTFYTLFTLTRNPSDIHVYKHGQPLDASAEGPFAKFIDDTLSAAKLTQFDAEFGNDEINKLYRDAIAEARARDVATAGSAGVPAVSGGAGAADTSAVSVVGSFADDSATIGWVKLLDGTSGQLTKANFSDLQFLPCFSRLTGSLYSFLLKKSDLVERIQILRNLFIKGKRYTLVVLDNAKSDIQVYEGANASNYSLEDFKEDVLSAGDVKQLHVVFGNEEIKRLYREAVAQASARETATSSAGGAGAAASSLG
jgi:hypothetical protein